MRLSDINRKSDDDIFSRDPFGMAPSGFFLKRSLLEGCPSELSDDFFCESPHFLKKYFLVEKKGKNVN